MSISLKPCTTSDITVLRDISVKAFYETFAPMNTAEDMKEYLETAFNADKLRRQLNNKNSSFFLLYSDGKAAGYLKLNEAPSQTEINDENSLEIERIYVLSEFQGIGAGSFLMDNAIAAAKERGKKYVWLGVWEKNEKAIRFYQKHGFRKIGTHSFVVGSDKQTDYIMRLDLEAE